MPQTVRHTLFETPLGWIGLAWSEAGVVRLQLPAENREATERALLRRPGSGTEDSPPPHILSVITLIHRYTNGEAVDFSAVPVVIDGVEPLRRSIYAALRKIRHGETLTYGELADRAGFPGQAQMIGHAMGRNPVPLIVPCHRVLAAGGKPGGFSAPGGLATKERMLALEGVRLGPPPSPQAAFAF